MNVAARATAITASWYHKSRTSLYPPAGTALSYARVHTRRPYALLSIWVRVYETYTSRAILLRRFFDVVRARKKKRKEKKKKNNKKKGFAGIESFLERPYY